MKGCSPKGAGYRPRARLDEAVPHTADMFAEQHGAELDDDGEWVVDDLGRLKQRLASDRGLATPSPSRRP